MPTPTKPAAVIRAEGRAHKTKAELAARERAEEGMLTGQRLREDPAVRDNPVAHATFLRTRKLLAAVGKDDALYGAQINRYCLLTAECAAFEEKREFFFHQLEDFEAVKSTLIQREEISYKEAVSIEQKFQSAVLAVDKQIQAKRKMLFDLERENVMSIAASLRSIPKTPDKTTNPLLEALRGSG